MDRSEGRKSGTGKMAADHGMWVIRCVDFCHRAFAIAGNRPRRVGQACLRNDSYANPPSRVREIAIELRDWVLGQSKMSLATAIRFFADGRNR
jgi:hypothetical protein